MSQPQHARTVENRVVHWPVTDLNRQYEGQEALEVLAGFLDKLNEDGWELRTAVHHAPLDVTLYLTRPAPKPAPVKSPATVHSSAKRTIRRPPSR